MSAKSRSYKDLEVWKLSMDFVPQIYDATRRFPREELFGLVSQMRRAAISIASNIAEGSKRGSHMDFRRFLLMARGSGAELETQLEIACRLGLISREECTASAQKLDRIMGMLHSLIAKMTENPQTENRQPNEPAN